LRGLKKEEAAGAGAAVDMAAAAAAVVTAVEAAAAAVMEVEATGAAAEAVGFTKWLHYSLLRVVDPDPHVSALFELLDPDPDPEGQKCPTNIEKSKEFSRSALFFFQCLVIKTLDSELDPDPQLGKMLDQDPH
jgi:hypothetical protein